MTMSKNEFEAYRVEQNAVVLERQKFGEKTSEKRKIRGLFQEKDSGSRSCQKKSRSSQRRRTEYCFIINRLENITIA